MKKLIEFQTVRGVVSIPTSVIVGISRYESPGGKQTVYVCTGADGIGGADNGWIVTEDYDAAVGKLEDALEDQELEGIPGNLL